MKEIIINYNEIAIKGKNRILFEQRLMTNIQKSLKKGLKKIHRRLGMIFCEISEGNLDSVIEKLKRVPGIAHFSPAIHAKLDIDEINKKTLGLLREKKFNSFKINASRSYRKFKLNSMEINRITGAFVQRKMSKRVDVNKPDIEVFIKVGEKEAFIFTEKIPGVRGLPVGSVGKIVSSLSGGIDSPVASYMMMKRGCEVVFVHIHNQSRTDKILENKIRGIVRGLTKYQISSKFYLVPFAGIQKKIIIFVPAESRMIIYRRVMMKILNKIAHAEKIKAIVTGDNVGQVASQTLENIDSIFDASELPVLTPLSGMNKEEIISLSKKIGTYEHSIKPYPDCCSFMIAKQPKTKSKKERIEAIEGNIEGLDELIEDAVGEAKIEKISGN
jgi:thiamine biosynthesis protein ThiI